MTINVTKTFLPPLEEYTQYLKRIWDSGWVTNNGELVQELEIKLAEFLGVPHVQFVTNGTIALQIAMHALDVKGEVITTPYSYVATSNAILWEHCKPIFVDIDPRSFCIDPEKIEDKITEYTSAILAVHVYGYPCNIKSIGEIATNHNLKVIYDGAHAFGCVLNDTSLLNYGDLSTLSFHATKLFHTVEGGAIIAHTPEMSDKLFNLKSFGHRYDDYFLAGINGKNSEFHAAMGLCILPKVRDLIENRKQIFYWYMQELHDLDIRLPTSENGLIYNYSYFPVLFNDESRLLRVVAGLKRNDIIPRRYFFPALNTLPFLNGQHCPIAEDVSLKVLCLPLYFGLSEEQVQIIGQIVRAEC